MTPVQADRLGNRAGLAEWRGDAAGASVLFRQVMHAAQELVRKGKRAEANAVCQSFEDAYQTAQYRELRATGGVEPGM